MQRRRVAPAPSSRYNEAMKTLLLLVVLSLFAPFALALSVPWDSLDGTQAQPVSPGQSIALNGATEWVLRVALPGFTPQKREFSGTLQLKDTVGNVAKRGAFKWYLPDNPQKQTITVAKTPEALTTTTDAASVEWQQPYLEWRKTANYLQMFVVSSDGQLENLRGSWNLSDMLIAYDHLSLEVSDPDAFDSVQFMVVTPGSSDPNAPEPGAFLLILLGGGVLLVLRRPSQWRGDR